MFFFPLRSKDDILADILNQNSFSPSLKTDLQSLRAYNPKEYADIMNQILNLPIKDGMRALKKMHRSGCISYVSRAYYTCDLLLNNVIKKGIKITTPLMRPFTKLLINILGTTVVMYLFFGISILLYHAIIVVMVSLALSAIPFLAKIPLVILTAFAFVTIFKLLSLLMRNLNHHVSMKLEQEVKDYDSMLRRKNNPKGIMQKISCYIAKNITAKLASKISLANLSASSKYIDIMFVCSLAFFSTLLPLPVAVVALSMSLIMRMIQKQLLLHYFSKVAQGTDTEELACYRQKANDFSVTETNLRAVKELLNPSQQQAFINLCKEAITQLDKALKDLSFKVSYATLSLFQGKIYAVNPELLQNDIIIDINNCISTQGMLGLSDGVSIKNQPKLNAEQLLVIENIKTTFKAMANYISPGICHVQNIIEVAPPPPLTLYFNKRLRLQEGIIANKVEKPPTMRLTNFAHNETQPPLTNSANNEVEEPRTNHTPRGIFNRILKLYR